MEELRDYLLGGAIGVIAFFSRWWFIKTDKKIEDMNLRISENEKGLELNAQSDKDYRDNTSKVLDEIKQTQNEIYKILISK